MPLQARRADSGCDWIWKRWLFLKDGLGLSYRQGKRMGLGTEEGVGLISGSRKFLRGFRAIGNQTFACGEDLENGQDLSSGFFGELR